MAASFLQFTWTITAEPNYWTGWALFLCRKISHSMQHHEQVANLSKWTAINANATQTTARILSFGRTILVRLSLSIHLESVFFSLTIRSCALYSHRKNCENRNPSCFKRPHSIFCSFFLNRQTHNTRPQHTFHSIYLIVFAFILFIRFSGAVWALRVVLDEFRFRCALCVCVCVCEAVGNWHIFFCCITRAPWKKYPFIYCYCNSCAYQMK